MTVERHPPNRLNEKEDTMDKLTRYGFLRTNVCLSSDVDALEAENARLLQDRLDYSNVKTTDGMNSSEWIWRTGKAERERDALEARVKNLKDDLKSTIESSNEMSDRNGELTAELARLKQRYNDEVAEFNAGFEAAKGGKSIDDEPNNCPFDVWKCGFAWGAFDGLRAELTALRERVKDYEEDRRTIMSERCGDEVHCTCVPPLRAEVKRLTAELAALHYRKKRMEVKP